MSSTPYVPGSVRLPLGTLDCVRVVTVNLSSGSASAVMGRNAKGETVFARLSFDRHLTAEQVGLAACALAQEYGDSELVQPPSAAPILFNLGADAMRAYAGEPAKVGHALDAHA